MKTELPKRYIFAVSSLLVIAGTLVAGGTTHYWLQPWYPPVLFLLLGTLPMAIYAGIGSIFFDPRKTSDAWINKDSPPYLERVRLAITPIAAAALAIGGLLTSWFAPPVRVAIAHLSADMGLIYSLENGLNDVSPEVRLAACEGLGVVGMNLSDPLVASHLQDRDDRVVDCILDTLRPGPAIDDIRVQSIAAAWARELMHEDGAAVEPERACQLADRLRRAERLGSSVASTWLFQCALDASSDGAKSCCGQSLHSVLGGSGASLSMAMPPPQRLAGTEFDASIPSALSLAFSDEPERAQLQQSLGATTPEHRAWTLGLACESLAISSPEDRERVGESLARAVAQADCHPPAATETTVRVWTAACSEVLTSRGQDTANGDEPRNLCTAVQRNLALDAVNEARLRATRAWRHAYNPTVRRKLLQSLLDYDSGLDSLTGGRHRRYPTGFAAGGLAPSRGGLLQMVIGGAPDPSTEPAGPPGMGELMRDAQNPDPDIWDNSR